MQNKVLRTTLAVVAIIALVICSFGISSAQGKKKGPALQQLEREAGKKIEDVKVPEVPKPTPVQPNTQSTNRGTKTK